MLAVLLQGVGAMGQEMVRALQGCPDVELVGAIDSDPQLIGSQLGDRAGGERWRELRIAGPGELPGYRPDVALLATTAFAAVAAPQIEQLLAIGADVVTIVQELVHPIGARVAIARGLDETARARGRTVISAGVNPGFVMDALVVAACQGVRDVTRVDVTRVVDFSPYGPDEMLHIGAGLTPAEFAAGAEDGHIGHIGLLESGAMLASALALPVEVWHQTKEPIVAQAACATRFVSIAPGQVRGFRQTVTGSAVGTAGTAGTDGATGTAGATVVTLTLVGLLDVGSHADDPPLGDTARVAAVPNVEMHVAGEFSQRGGEATAAVATNLIQTAVDGPPGLLSVLDLPLRRPAAGS